jgi:DNA-binding HxlR family transcriptional regulator
MFTEYFVPVIFAPSFMAKMIGIIDHEKRYNELRREMPTITEMTLSLQLKQLEHDSLVSRKVYDEKPPVKVVYSLTDFW